MSAIKFNGSAPNKIMFNGDEVDKIMFNGSPFDINSDHTIVLLHFEDDYVNGQITDARGNIFVRNNSNASIVNSRHKFGSSSGSWTGISYTNLLGSTQSLNFLNSDFTIDFWVYLNETNGRKAPFSLGLSNVSGLAIDIDNTIPRMWFAHPTQADKWLIGGEDYTYDGASNIAISAGTWNHLAMVRNSGNVSLYVNGQPGRSVNIGNVSLKNIGNYGAQCGLGIWGVKGNQYSLNGFIDEFRITNNAAWTGAFIPPNEPYV